MKINPLIIEQYWSQIVVEQLVYVYGERGYQIKKRPQINDGVFADLCVQNNEETIYFQVKTNAWSNEDITKANNIRKFVTSNLKAKYEIVWSSPPQEKTIIVQNIESLLLSIIEEDIGELDSLSSQTFIESVEDVEIFSAEIGRDETKVIGEGSVNVELNYGGSKEDVSFGDSYPFTFEILIGQDFSVLETLIDIDTSSFYE